MIGAGNRAGAICVRLRNLRKRKCVCVICVNVIALEEDPALMRKARRRHNASVARRETKISIPNPFLAAARVAARDRRRVTEMRFSVGRICDVIDNHHCDFDSGADRRAADVALQFELGLRPRRIVGNSPRRRGDSRLAPANPAEHEAFRQKTDRGPCVTGGRRLRRVRRL
jgi:hypothetical protein